MGVPWRELPEEVARLLRRRGMEPGGITDVPAAWQAFREFLAVPADGLAPEPDADGFIVQWGRNSWNDDLPSLTFTRQLVVDVCGSPGGQAGRRWPECWQLHVNMVFSDAPALADLDQLNVQDTGFDFSPPGPGRDHALDEAEWESRHYPTLRALWASTPVRSGITLERAD